ncbi:NAC domain-containing protein 72-like, partial [Trifolium medium]|nr:NAC domain-containing protein 72-like [Trifolium medium]
MYMRPLGVGFLPTDEILVGYYLANKNSEKVQVSNGYDLIIELDLYAYDPFDFPYTLFYYTIKNQLQFYCFTGKVDEEMRHCKSGFRMKKKHVRDNTSVGNVVLEKKTLFNFYIGNFPKTASRTN